MDDSLGEKDLDKLYKDAIYMHLIGKGYTEFEAEKEAKLRTRKNNEF